jgi:hypothetical protein
MSPGEGPRKVIVYAPVMQANLVALTPMTQEGRANMAHAYTVHCDEDGDWVMLLKSDAQMEHLEKQISVAREVEAISTRPDAVKAGNVGGPEGGSSSGRVPSVLLHSHSDGGKSAGSALMKVVE